jgi:hypothetical protein
MAEYFTEFLTAAVATECIADCACSAGALGRIGLYFPQLSLKFALLEAE